MKIQEQLKRSAGAWLLSAGLFLLLAQAILYVAMDTSSIASTVQSPFNVYYNMLNLFGYISLLVGLQGWALQSRFGVGKFAMVRWLITMVGTLLVFGDVWFESFAVPSTVKTAPELLNVKPGVTLITGMLITALFFSLGWLMIALHAIIKKGLPLWCGILLAVGSLCSFFPLIALHIVPFAISIVIIGWKLYGDREQSVSSKGNELSM
ncbi:hypothetical protein [Marininema halotolerans]|uniref:DUF4386 domain-containing protein n=1 Tax=Marininema halotolerans TaxID=1155944 RepID=A0A1I6PQQ9_9BACL|nr:hypothetical protein [Marininema halotolerans]SFS42549.1 hypothetical protein SAMN05444972_10272 [Marininema halotolerans]